MSLASLPRFAVLLLSLFTVLVAGVSRAEPVRLTLLAFTDLHGAIAEGVRDRDSGKTLGGGSALLAVVEEERRRDPEATLLFDVGDSMQGTALSNLTRGRAAVDLLNLLGVDATVVGNHGFDWGVEVLVERMEQASFPILAANVVEKESGRAPGWARPYHLLERRGVRVAVAGLLTQTTPQETIPENVAAYRFTDPAAAAPRLVAELVPEKADLVVLLCHFGLSAGDAFGTELKDTAAAGTRYCSASLETSDWRGLEVGFLYDEDRVDLVDYYQLSGDDVVEAFGEGIFRTREPLVGVFRFPGSEEKLYVFANKFKTKRGEDPRMSLNERPVHMLVSPALLELLAGTDVLHFNAGVPDVLQKDRTTPLRASDRDPVEGRFYFPDRARETER